MYVFLQKLEVKPVNPDGRFLFVWMQLTNHGIPNEVILNMVEGSKRFFELPFEERSKYMSTDMYAPVRYGTSFNQNKDRVFCWRDFLKLSCQPLSGVLPFWPSSPVDFRWGHIQASFHASDMPAKDYLPTNFN